MDFDKFIHKQQELLELEKAAELEKNMCMQEKCSMWYLQKKGLCIPRLQLESSESKYYGHTLRNLVPLTSGARIRSHSIKVGDVAGILQKVGSQWVTASTGVVACIKDQSIGIACKKLPGAPDIKSNIHYALIRLVDDVTYRRLQNALKNLSRCRSGRIIALKNVLFNRQHPSHLDVSTYANLKFFNDNLNESQKDAVKFCLCQNEVAIIHGPPGTGKTTTVVEVIVQLVSEGKKVLACASSNVSVDNLVEKLSSCKVKMIRLGHPARSLPGAHSHSLDALISSSDGAKAIRDISANIDHVKELLSNNNYNIHQRLLKNESYRLIEELKDKRKTVVKQVMTSANVILSTFSGASLDGPIKHLPQEFFDVVVIDECSQALEAACWIALLHAPKCIVAGDHCQLPPIIMSTQGREGGLGITLMERLIKMYGNVVTRMLTTQYRMNNVIMKWASEQLYDGKLVAHSSVTSHLLRDIPGVKDTGNTKLSLLLIDTSKSYCWEIQDENDSKGNEGEADLVAIHVSELVKSGMRSSDIAVVAPYNFQIQLIRKRLREKYPKLEVMSIDRFQGREKEAVVLSLVRSNQKKDIGFLTDIRRINVAITRSRRHLAVICDSHTVSSHRFLKHFLKYLKENGEVRSAAMYDKKIRTYTPYKKSTKIIAPPKHNVEPAVSEEKKLDESSCSDKKANPMLHFEANAAYRNIVIEKYRPELKEFCEGPKTSLRFPSTLNDFEQLIVHELAEDLELICELQGQSEDRHIEIRKHSAPCTNKRSFKVLMDACQLQEQRLESTTDVAEATETANRKDNILTSSAKRMKLDHTKSNNKNKKPKLQPLPYESKSGVPGADAVITDAMKANKNCSFAECKNCSSIMSQVCQFCKKQFCLSHMMPEIHGCGVVAKAHARSMMCRNGVIYPGSARPEKKIDPAKREELHRDLIKTLLHCADTRRKFF